MSLQYNQNGTYAVVDQADYDELIVSVSDIKKQLNISHNSDDDLILTLSHAAQNYVQDYLSKYINEQVITYSTNELPIDNIIWVTRGPFIRGASGIDGNEGLYVYIATEINVYDTLVKNTDYTYTIVDGLLRIQIINRPTLITTLFDALVVEYTCGWSNANIPKNIYQAITILAAHLYNNRDIVATGTIISGELPFSFRALLDMERTKLFN